LHLFLFLNPRTTNAEDTRCGAVEL